MREDTGGLRGLERVDLLRTQPLELDGELEQRLLAGCRLDANAAVVGATHLRQPSIRSLLWLQAGRRASQSDKVPGGRLRGFGCAPKCGHVCGRHTDILTACRQSRLTFGGSGGPPSTDLAESASAGRVFARAGRWQSRTASVRHLSHAIDRSAAYNTTTERMALIRGPGPRAALGDRVSAVAGTRY